MTDSNLTAQHKFIMDKTEEDSNEKENVSDDSNEHENDSFNMDQNTIKYLQSEEVVEMERPVIKEDSVEKKIDYECKDEECVCFDSSKIYSKSKSECVKCRNGWTKYKNTCFLETTLLLNWNDYLSFCESLNSSLVILNDQEKFDYYQQIAIKLASITGYLRTWVGAVYNSTYEYKWLNGMPMNKSFFSSVNNKNLNNCVAYFTLPKCMLQTLVCWTRSHGISVYRDLLGIRLFIDIKLTLSKFQREKTNTFKEFQKLVKQHPDKACIIYDNKIWTFKDLEDYSNRIANLFASSAFGYKKGDCVAVFMENRPEYVGIWLGLSKIGVISALINTNLKGEPLRHSISSSKALAVVYNQSLEQAIGEIKNDLGEVKLLFDGDKQSSIGATNLNSLLNKTESDNIHPEGYAVTSEDTILYIYTSGTTGLPKPAVIKQSRYYGGASTFFRAAGLGKNDIVYVTLPIYHGNGTLLGIGSAITVGSTIVLRKKFSASNFWKDCIEYNCTSFIYVGEICRFLVNQQPSQLDKAHKVRKAYGNGLRANVWIEFNQRFGVKCLEFYAASEGNCTMLNLDYKVGSCGFKPLITRLVKSVYPIYLIRIDDQMNPIRDEKGFCIECSVGEKGLLIGIIGNEPTKAFNGYANNPEASKKKIINDVFKSGQKAFNTGDAMLMDRFGYFYFCDRLGDTYRWRGENVSTVEVENQISRFLNSKEVVVYGVEIPGQEGRAGMVSIAESPDSIDVQYLSKRIKEELPSYSRPLFMRFTSILDHTGTFKAKKTKLVEEAYNIKILNDHIYYFDAKDELYKKMNDKLYEDILNGRIRL